MEEAFHGGVVVTIAFSTHAAQEAMEFRGGLVIPEAYWLPRSEWAINPGAGRRRQTAMVRAAMTRSRVIRSAMAQPTTARE